MVARDGMKAGNVEKNMEAAVAAMRAEETSTRREEEEEEEKPEKGAHGHGAARMQDVRLGFDFEMKKLVRSHGELGYRVRNI